MYTKGAMLMRQPALREPLTWRKQDDGGSSGSKPSKPSSDKAPSPKKPQKKADADSGGKPSERRDTKQGPDSESEEAADQGSASSASSASSSSDSENEDPKKEPAASGEGPAAGAVKVEDSEVKFRRLMNAQLESLTGPDEVAKVLGRLVQRSRDDDSYAPLAAQLKIVDIPRERFVLIMEEYETKHGISQELKDKWYKGIRPAAKAAGAPSNPTEASGNDDSEPAPTKYKPLNHRLAKVPPSCLKSNRARSNTGLRKHVTYKDGNQGDDKGPELEARHVVVSHRFVQDLWFQQPGSQVTCDRCLRVWPQTMGMLAGSAGRSQFAQDQWLCSECIAMG